MRNFEVWSLPADGLAHWQVMICFRAGLAWAVHAWLSKQYQTYSKVIRIPAQMSGLVDMQSWSFPESYINIQLWYNANNDQIVRKCITVTSWWARWHLKSPASWLFIQPFIQAQIKENIKALRHWPLWREFTHDRWIPRANGQ